MTLQDIHGLYARGQLQKAEDALAKYALREGNTGPSLQLGALVAMARRDLPLAFQRIRASLQDRANSHEKLNTQGNILRALNAAIDAEMSYRQALQLAPDYVPARANLAAHLQKTGQPDLAEAEFRKLTEMQPEVATHWKGLAQSLTDLNRPEEALAVLEGSPLDGETTAFLRGRAQFALGRFEDAMASNREAFGHGELGSEAFKLSLQILAMTGAWEAMASPLIEDVLSHHPASDAHWSVALNALWRAGREAEANQLFGRAPRGPATLAARAEAHVNRGQFADGEALALQALEAAPGFPPALYQLAFASLGLAGEDPSKAGQAQAVSDLALQSNPHNQFFWGIKALGGRLRGQEYRYYFDYERFVKPYDIPAPEGWESVEAFNRDLAAELDALHGFTDAPLDQTLRLGTQTSPNLRFVQTPAIQAFFGAVEPAIQSYVDGIGHDKQHAFLRQNYGSFRIRSGWSVKLRPGGGHHINHIHPEGWISSAYYVDVPDTEGVEGWIKFGEPPEEIRKATGLDYEHIVQPKPGRLVLFPSYMWHGTVPFGGSHTRMTLPIDILPAKKPKEP